MAATAQRPDDLRREPVLPPGFSLVTQRESGDAFARACKIAPEAGAATIVWTRRFDIIEFAVVLEPENPLCEARLAHYLAMNALADALAVYSPPERPILFRWPDALVYDLGLIGGGRLAWPEGCGENEVPDWLVFGAMLRATTMTPFALGQSGVGMAEEGFEEVDAVDLLEAFARHLMLGVTHWQSDGPKAAARRWLDRLDKVVGTRHGIESNGDLVATTQAGTERRSLVEALARVDWLDRENGGPKL
ncbi:MAG TPA: biotin/lipoate--protein ligase family protein [Bosea sp. (in: a-proteobacteria)]|jgi:biotin-(acetyl-CoA carboxylase) ligase|uniref:biotin/lipoate--protein ligase family protein n=1 Tax=Bosea sp. (in: a-proteobacteria) TaxID=1871050 RepID=UPI002E106B84|nr:biotin/lipoate--protein ligase family protein [Bosea sp. (in: a-proteobacteria)]